MPKTIFNDLGEEEVVYTEAEIAERDNANKEALQKKTGELLDVKRNAETIETAAQTQAREALERVEKIESENREREQKRIESVRDFLIEQYVGEGASDEAKKKMLDSWNMLSGMEITDEKQIVERVRAAAKIAGFDNPSNPSSVNTFMPTNSTISSFGSFNAPNVTKEEGVSESDHKAFLSETGYNDATLA